MTKWRPYGSPISPNRWTSTGGSRRGDRIGTEALEKIFLFFFCNHTSNQVFNPALGASSKKKSNQKTTGTFSDRTRNQVVNTKHGKEREEDGSDRRWTEVNLLKAKAKKIIGQDGCFTSIKHLQKVLCVGRTRKMWKKKSFLILVHLQKSVSHER